MKLFELRNSTLENLQKKFPNMPRYVLFDFIYKNLKNDMDALGPYIENYANLRWEQKVLNITIDIFDKQTQQQLIKRDGGKSNPNKVPNDQKRHATQRDLLSSAPSSEPIIVMQTDDGYELIEGWHRTIQSLQKWQNGYKQPAWIGIK